MYLDKIKQVAQFFERNIKNNKIICPACNIEHTGRNAYSIKIFLYLYEKAKEKKYFDLAYMIAKNTMNNLKSPPESNGKYKVFYPGLYTGSKNNSSNVIDSGICVDMICEFLLFCRNNVIDIIEYKEWFTEIEVHIKGYLFNASMDKVCLNQRLWGLTGIATFYKLTKYEYVKEHIEQSLDKLFKEQNEDGSFDYIVNRDTVNSKFSLYYFPRLLAFVVYCMDSIEYFKYIEKLKKAITLLIDCYDEKYNKLLALENKKWFFTASYEIESLAYDLFIMKYFGLNEIFDKQIDLYLDHIDNNGIISNKEDKANLCCEFIDNSDFSWFIRSLELKQYIKIDYKYIKQDRNYKEANIFIKFDKDKKNITLKNDFSYNSYWGGMNNLQIIVSNNDTKYIYPKHYYTFKFHPNLKFNLQNFKNIYILSQYNIKFKNQRRYYLFKKIVDFFKYDIFENGYK